MFRALLGCQLPSLMSNTWPRISYTVDAQLQWVEPPSPQAAASGWELAGPFSVSRGQTRSTGPWPPAQALCGQMPALFLAAGEIRGAEG